MTSSTRRVPQTIKIRDSFAPSSPQTGGVAAALMACHASGPQGTAVAVAGLQFTMYSAIAFGISWLANDDPITYSLSIVDQAGAPLASSGLIVATPVAARVTGVWNHGLSALSGNWVWVYMTTDAAPFLDAVEWSMAMINLAV